MAATDKIQVFMTQTGERFWTNVFHVNALTILDAAAFANITLVPLLAGPMDGTFRVVRTLVSHIADDTFVTTPMNIPGGQAGSPYLPLFNTIKVLIGVQGFGRNDYKFLRGIITEGNQDNGRVIEPLRDSLTDAWNAAIGNGNASGVDLVDNAGNPWLLASVQESIQMRQLHRKRKKKPVTP